MAPSTRTRLDLQRYVDGITRGDRVVLARGITLVESERPADRELAARLLDALLPHTGRARRVGITGVPGVGKSTFVDALGTHVIREHGERLAVLTVDPSSAVSGGSILGDKTRMERLAGDEGAYIRPSPSRGRAGGVAPRTRETILLCEAAGFANVLVETVGVGQSETAVRAMTDVFLLLMLPGAGDELQGIKRGIIEMADAMIVTKADGANRPRAERARSEYAGALHLFPVPANGWRPRVLMCSAVTGEGVAEVWDLVLEHRSHVGANGSLERRRREQALAWMRDIVVVELETAFQTHPRVAARLPALESAVREGHTTPVAAAHELAALFRERS